MKCRCFSQTLGKALVQSGYSNEQVRGLVKVGLRQFTDWEHGVRIPEHVDVYNLAVALNVPYQYLCLVALLDISPEEGVEAIVETILRLGWPVPDGVEQRLPTWQRT